MSMENVLNEVDSLFQKISSLPENFRQVAIHKIQERLNPKDLGKTRRPVVKPRSTGRSSTITKSCVPSETPHSFSTDDVFINHCTDLLAMYLSADVKAESSNVSTSVNEKQSLLRPATTEDINNVKKTKKPLTRCRRRVPNVVHVNVHPSCERDPMADTILESHIPVEPNVLQVVSQEMGEKTFVQTKQQVENLQCDICSLWIEGRNNFKKHLKIHNPKRPYACIKCDKTFRQSSNLKVHMKRHNDQRDFPCGTCEYRSVTKLDLERHLSIHSKSRDLICEFCAKAFSVKRSLCLHIRTMHNRDTDKFFCSECSFVTHRKNNLKVHLRLRHLGDYYTHVCPVCSARVKLKSAFLEHLRAHTGDRPFACDLCPASFACVGRLNTHRRTIHAPRQFICATCGNKFPTKYSLQRHETVHTNDKPHSCPFCSFACNMQGNLTKHVRNMHSLPDFSLREYKRQQQASGADTRTRHRKKWTETGQKAFNQYLNTFSKKLGRKVTVGELKAQEEDRRKVQVAAKEKAKIERINRITSKEHSYFLRPESPAPSSPEVLPLSSNIYLEAIAAANLDFTSATLGESIPIPDLVDPSTRSFPLLPGTKLPPMQILGYSEDFSTSSQSYMSHSAPHDKLSMDPMLSTYSDVLQIPSLGLDTLSSQTSYIDVPNVFVQLPSGEKVQLSLNFLRDCQLIDSGVGDQAMSTHLGEGLGEFLPSVMIVVSEDQQDNDPPP